MDLSTSWNFNGNETKVSDLVPAPKSWLFCLFSLILYFVHFLFYCDSRCPHSPSCDYLPYPNVPHLCLIGLLVYIYSPASLCSSQFVVYTVPCLPAFSSCVSLWLFFWLLPSEPLKACLLIWDLCLIFDCDFAYRFSTSALWGIKIFLHITPLPSPDVKSTSLSDLSALTLTPHSHVFHKVVLFSPVLPKQ